MPKTIAFDLRPLQIGHQNRGIGMVVRNIIENLEDTENSYIFYCFDSSNPIEDLKIKVAFQYEIVTTPQVTIEVRKPSDLITTFGLLYHSFRPLRHIGIDTFVQFDHNLGLPKFHRTKTVVIAYDLIPLIFRNKYLPRPWFAFTHSSGKKARVAAFLRAAYYTIKSHVAYKNYHKADSVVAISETVKQSFVDILGVDGKKISVAQLAAASEATGFDDKILKKHKLQDAQYIIYIGGTDSRKCVADIVHAFNITNGRGGNLKLVLAGNEFKKVTDIPDVDARNAILESPYKDQIILAGFVSDKEKNSLYKHAHAFVLTSLYEGFGLPVVEAQAKDCPVIAYDNSAVAETAKDSALLVESGNYTKIAEAISILQDENARNAIIEKGAKNAQEYSWIKTVEALKNTY